MMVTLTHRDIAVLRALASGNGDVPRSYRMRLEMLGFATDGPDGLCLTEAGRAAAESAPAAQAESEARLRPEPGRDVMGRRLFRRKLDL